VPHYRIPPPRKVSPGRQFSGKNDTIFAGKLSTGRRLYWEGGDLIMGRLFYEAGDILIRRRHINSVIISFRVDLCDTGAGARH